MAYSGGKKGADDELCDKILGLQKLMEATRKNIEKLMEKSLQEGTADDLEEIARNENAKLEDLRQRLSELERDCVHLVFDPLELEQYHKRFQEFAQELNKIDQRINENLMVLEAIQEPTEVNKATEEQDRSPDLPKTKELQASSDAADYTLFGNLVGKIMLQSDLQEMEKFSAKKIQEEAPASRYEKPPSPPKNPTTELSPEAAAARINGKKKIEHLLPIGTNWNLCDIIMDMYGFGRTESQKIEMHVEKAFTQNPYHGIGSSKGERILDWKGVWNVKEMLQESKSKSERVQILIPGLLKIWIFRVENQMYNLVFYVRCIMSGYEPAMARFQELRTSLGECRQRNIGRVPIVAYRILKLLEMQVPEEQSELNRDQQEALYRDSGFDQVIGSIQKMIFRWKSLLVVSGVANHARRINPNELERCEQVLGEAEEELIVIERRIMEGRKNVQIKRKREGEDGGNGSGSGSLEMRETGRGKMASVYKKKKVSTVLISNTV